jgi:hypothetical protein
MLDLNHLSAGQPGLTPALGAAMAEAGAVCLEQIPHTLGVQIVVGGSFQSAHDLHWPTVTDQVRRTWSDLREATKKGSEGIAILLINEETDYTTIERAAIGTRIDRWLGYQSDAPDFQRRARLEISGILRGDDGDVRRRSREKMDRLTLASSQLPAFVIVVEFSRPLAEVSKK